MSQYATTEALRPLSAASRLLAEYGAALPEEVETARRVFLDLGRQRPVEPDLRAIGAKALDVSPKAAAKDLAEARLAIDVHSASLDVAAHRALRALLTHRDAVVSAVLTSPTLAAAVDEIRAVAPTVRPDVPRNPGPGSTDDDVIGAAVLRKVEGIIERAAVGLSAIPDLGFYVEPDSLALLWVDPSEVAPADLGALPNALRGIRAGHVDIPVMIRQEGTSMPVRSEAAWGIRSAAAAAVRGVSFRMVSSLGEYEERLRIVERSASSSVEESSLASAVVFD